MSKQNQNPVPDGLYGWVGKDQIVRRFTGPWCETSYALELRGEQVFHVEGDLVILNEYLSAENLRAHVKAGSWATFLPDSTPYNPAYVD